MMTLALGNVRVMLLSLLLVSRKSIVVLGNVIVHVLRALSRNVCLRKIRLQLQGFLNQLAAVVHVVLEAWYM